MDRKTRIWWTFLRGVSVVDIALLVATALWVRPTAWPAAAHLLCAAIALAQTVCWLWVLTRDHRCHAVGESLWGIETVAVGVR